MALRGGLLLGLFAVLGIAVQVSNVSSQNQLPSFCGNYDCPKYQLVKRYVGKFELRQYEETRWATTSLQLDSFDMGMVTSFVRLLRYITGNNAEGLMMSMTVPVVVYMPVIQPPTGNATMSFFVPHKVDNPPKPTDPEIYLHTLPSTSVYVKTFGGYALNAMYAKQANALAEDLRNFGLQFDDMYFVGAGYNSAFDAFYRHNEVWYMVNSSEPCGFLYPSADEP